MIRAALGGLLAAVMAIALVASAQAPIEQPAPPPGAVLVDCNQYANAAYRIAVMRTVDARLELVIDRLRFEVRGAPEALADALTHEARLVYAEGLSPDDALFQAFRRCQAVLGKFGADT